MSAAAAMAAAQAAGITLTVRSGKLRLESSVKPAAELIELIRQSKPGIVKLLEAPRAAIQAPRAPDSQTVASVAGLPEAGPSPEIQKAVDSFVREASRLFGQGIEVSAIGPRSRTAQGKQSSCLASIR
jgi:hypothetical protein